MELAKHQPFHQYIHVDSYGQYTASYHGLVLQSVYQPIFNRQYNIVAVEALVRITTEQNTHIRPDLFFSSNCFSDEEKIQVERLCRAIHIRNFAHSPFCQLNLFLNMLPAVGEQCIDSDRLYAQFFSTLGKLHLDNQQIVMELLEFPFDDKLQLLQITNHYKNNGFHVAIDDFGTEASNKERVDMIKPQIIKIDRSLLLQYMSGNRAPLLNAVTIAQQCHALTVIEGIETRIQWDAMTQLPIDFYQGFYLAMPQPCLMGVAGNQPRPIANILDTQNTLVDLSLINHH